MSSIAEYIVWFNGNWHIPIISSCIYLLLVYLGVKVMESRKGYALKEFLFLWNLILAVFSIMGALNLSRNIMKHSQESTEIKQTFCLTDFAPESGVPFWTAAFALSKIYEFGDTIFIVLRKKPLMFLHYYHHVTALFVSWLSTSHDIYGIFIWASFINYAIHSIMYSYFCLSAIEVKFPRFIPMLITSLQIIQMFFLISVYITGYFTCKGKPGIVIGAASSIFASYALLFSMYFYNRYMYTAKDKKQ
jgi:hypothetical protein